MTAVSGMLVVSLCLLGVRLGNNHRRDACATRTPRKKEIPFDKVSYKNGRFPTDFGKTSDRTLVNFRRSGIIKQVALIIFNSDEL